MKPIVTILVLCLFVGQLGCHRKVADQTNANTSVESSTPDRSAEARNFLDQGKEFYRNDRDEKALEAFQQAIKLNPNLAEAYFRLGLTYDALGNQQEADKAYRAAVENYKKYFSLPEHEKDAEAHYNLAQAYAGLHLYSEAVREYRQATRLKEDDADVFYDLGTALTRLAQYDEAAAAFEKSLELDPENFRAEDGLAEAREGMKRIRAGKKHQEDLLKKQKDEEAKKQQAEGATPATEKKAENQKRP